MSPLILTLESTCDETACAIVRDDLQVLASVVASQDQLHLRYHGVVPEIAARAHVERILPVIDEAVRKARIRMTEVAAIAVANTPGLAGSLAIGLTAAKALAWALGKPLIAVNHLHAHVYACRIASRQEVFPCVGMVVSGGHSHLYDCRSALEFRFLGGTIDDAAGEAFDKVAAMLGLGFPGGPAVSRVAAEGDPRAYDFPRAFIRDRRRFDFSFSGLKTAVRYALVGQGKQDFRSLQLDPRQVADVAASFQQAVVDCLVAKAILALEFTARTTLCVGGGVAANRLLRKQLQQAIDARGWRLHIAPPALCTDNAVMGAIAFEHLRAGSFDALDIDIIPGLVRR
jgi:N6-L-threonylcarbamoyladenine synthase